MTALISHGRHRRKLTIGRAIEKIVETIFILMLVAVAILLIVGRAG